MRLLVDCQKIINLYKKLQDRGTPTDTCLSLQILHHALSQIDIFLKDNFYYFRAIRAKIIFFRFQVIRDTVCFCMSDN